MNPKKNRYNKIKELVERSSYSKDIIFHEDKTFRNNGLTELDIVELMMEVEEFYGIHLREKITDLMMTPNDLLKYLEQKLTLTQFKTVKNNTERTYVKITDESGHGFVETLRKSKEILSEMVQSAYDTGSPESYTFTTIDMTRQEFIDLPMFKGF